MTQRQTIYFASDFHLGLQAEDPFGRERRVVRWLDDVAQDALEIFLVGDIFDFWWEYKRVVPRGHTRFLGKLAELTDAGITIRFFPGNHDMWTFGYLEEETGLQVHPRPEYFERQGKRILVAHGEGLGPGQRGYKMLLWAFRNKVIRWMYSRLHPNFGVATGIAWSRKSRLGKGMYLNFQGEENELLVQYARKKLSDQPGTDYFVFGHRHLAMDYKLTEKTRALFLGEWIRTNSYVRMEKGMMELKYYES